MRHYNNQLLYEASVIIPTFNRADLLALTLQSLAQQACSRDFEVIVADDGSTDNTADVISAFKEKLHTKYVFYPDHGYHVTRARNMGLRLAEGRISIFLDCGNLVATNFVAAHCDAHRHNAGSAIVGYIYGFQHTDQNRESVMSALNPDDVDSSIERMKSERQLLDVREELYRMFDDDLQQSDVPWALFWGGNISVATDVATKVGGFDEHYKAWGADDIDFGLSLHLRGTKIRLARLAAAIQYPHKKDIEARRKAYRLNQEYLHSKYALEETDYLIGRSTSTLIRAWAERHIASAIEMP